MRGCVLFAALSVAVAHDALRELGTREAGIRGLTDGELYPPTVAVHSRTRAAHRRIMSSWTSARRARRAVYSSPRVLRPSDFGADPLCKDDSSAAFAALTAALVAMPVGNMSDGIADLGGVAIDLEGGCYSLSQPWALPQMIGNFHVYYGELRARDTAPTFPADASLVTVGAAACHTPSGQGSCNQNAGFHGVTFDGAHVAGACLSIYATMGAVVDSSSVVLGFVRVGIELVGGHEGMISDTWLAAYPWSSKFKENNNASGIEIRGNDHYVTNTICYSSKIGVLLTGAANILQGVHTWNSATGNGGTGIRNTMSQNRFIGVYLDFTDLVLVGDGAQQTSVTNSFFLGGAQIVFETTAKGTAVENVVLTSNTWYDTGSAALAVNETAAPWKSVRDLFTDTTCQAGTPCALPAPGRAVALPAVSVASDATPVDFSSGSLQLLFPSVPIDSVDCSATGTLVDASGGTTAMRCNVAGATVTVERAASAPSTTLTPMHVRVLVDQSSHSTVA